MQTKPLAARMRPKTLNDVVGQDHLIGDGKVLSRMVTSRTISSIILYGLPGIGKTSIAHALSNDLNLEFGYFNAGVHGKKELQDLTKNATEEKPIVILLDEVHRMTKPNQDFLLMHIEDGTVIMIGATTENPYMSISKALRSRSHIFELKSIDDEGLIKLIKKALTDNENGFGDKNVNISDEDIAHIANQAGGDCRLALGTLELAVKSTTENNTGEIDITREIINTCLQNKQIGGDKNGDSHYNLLSAFQKSIRGSDTDAALHYLARLIEAGDLMSINRRLLVIAYEDIGLANPQIPVETLAAIQSVERIGLPEARIILSHIVIRLTLSAKSNVGNMAIHHASDALKTRRSLEIPKHLHDTHYDGAKDLGKGVGYQYAHNYPYHFTPQNQLPDDFKNDQYLEFNPQNNTQEVENMYKMINNQIKRTDKRE